MLDMALRLKGFFGTAQWFEVGKERVDVKLDVAFGVAVGGCVVFWGLGGGTDLVGKVH